MKSFVPPAVKSPTKAAASSRTMTVGNSHAKSGAKALGTSSGGPICGDQAAAPWLVGGRRPTRGGPR
jgi:hypothetical protein